MRKITAAEIKKARHPNENSRFALALFICIPVLLVAVPTLITATMQSLYILGLVLTFIAAMVFLLWFSMKIFETVMIANSVRVSDVSFPEINSICAKIKESMEYSNNIPIFIMDEGGFNASLGKFFRRKYIILSSSLAEDMSKAENTVQLKWIIARFIGSLKTKRIRLDFLRILIESVDSIKLFGLFILPYKRASVYTGDNLGLVYCEDIEQVMIAFNKFLVGSKLSDKILFEGVLTQSGELKGTFFSLLARLTSTHPHMVYRYLNLLAFARKTQPDRFITYISRYDNQTIVKISKSLPNLY